MAIKTKRTSLGKNFNMLLGQIQTIQAVSQGKTAEDLKRLPIEYLSPGQYQPRRDFPPESLQELANSIRSQGIIQPIIVRSIAERRYEIIAGERRWRAAQLAGLHEVPAVIRTISDEAALAVALIENIQRENLNPMDEAIALSRMQQEFSLTHEKIAEIVGKSRAAVTNLIRLLQLEPEVRKWVEQQKISLGHAKVLLALEGKKQLQIAEAILERNLSVREAERLIAQLHPSPKPKVKTKVLPDIKRLEEQLALRLGAKVVISQNAKGRGKLVINYYSLDELEGILEQMLLNER